MARFCNKHIQGGLKRSITHFRPIIQHSIEETKINNTTPLKEENVTLEQATPLVVENNNEEKKEKDMTTIDKIQQANAILNNVSSAAPKAKRIKKDKGLIERVESSKIVLTEDNKELLVD